jgi:hypothetical protein
LQQNARLADGCRSGFDLDQSMSVLPSAQARTGLRGAAALFQQIEDIA